VKARRRGLPRLGRRGGTARVGFERSALCSIALGIALASGGRVRFGRRQSPPPPPTDADTARAASLFTRAVRTLLVGRDHARGSTASASATA
jgi:hypothetical protein